MFRMKEGCWNVYASGLKVRDDAPEEEKDLCRKIKKIFETGVQKDNYVDFFHHLLWYEETVVRRNLKEYNMSKVKLQSLENDSYALNVPGLSEKRPSLIIGDKITVKPHGNFQVLFEAEINDILEQNFVSIIIDDWRFKKFYRANARYDVRFSTSCMMLGHMHEAVSRVACSSLGQRRVFPQKNLNKVDVKPISEFFNPTVAQNPEQRCAVEHIVANSSGLAPYLLHGPPGTGKTVTIVEAILQLVKQDPGSRVLVCTDSNMAADHVAIQIIKFLPQFKLRNKFLLRVNSKSRVWETVPQSLGEFCNGRNRKTFKFVDIEEFCSYNIVVTTLSHAAKFAKELIKNGMEPPFRHLLIDEASQASEPAALIPVSGLLAPAGRLVLAGDPRQLGPVVVSHHARALGLGISLMERLKTSCPLYSDERADVNYTTMLRNNFRSDAAILRIPNELFYKGQLRVLAKPDRLSKVDILGKKQHSHAVVFHGVLSKEQRMGKSPSYYNDMELAVVKKYINLLIKKHRVKPDDIGVVTPYIGQANKMKEWLTKHKFEGSIEVGTVEAFQGKEKRVVLISTVRAASTTTLLHRDVRSQLGFLVDDKRFNVALTRAKAKVIIIGNPLCLEKDPKWRAYIQQCRKLGTYHGYDPQKNNAEEATQEIQEIDDKITRRIKKLSIS